MSEGESWSRKLDHEKERGGQGSARARLLWVCRLHFPAAPYSCCPSFVVVDIPPVAGDLCQRVSAAWAEGLAAGQDAGLSWGPSCQPILCRASVCKAQVGTIVPALQGCRVQSAEGASGLPVPGRVVGCRFQLGTPCLFLPLQGCRGQDLAGSLPHTCLAGLQG